MPKYGGVHVRPEQLRQVFNGTDEEELWLKLIGLFIGFAVFIAIRARQ